MFVDDEARVVDEGNRVGWVRPDGAVVGPTRAEPIRAGAGAGAAALTGRDGRRIDERLRNTAENFSDGRRSGSLLG